MVYYCFQYFDNTDSNPHYEFIDVEEFYNKINNYLSVNNHHIDTYFRRGLNNENMYYIYFRFGDWDSETYTDDDYRIVISNTKE